MYVAAVESSSSDDDQPGVGGSGAKESAAGAAPSPELDQATFFDVFTKIKTRNHSAVRLMVWCAASIMWCVCVCVCV